MSNLQILKSRIKSINIILKATNAVKIITNIKLAKLKNITKIIAQNFANQIKVVNALASYIIQEKINETNILNINSNMQKIAILIFSDKGLCGGYNTQLNKFFCNHLKNIDHVSYDKVFVIGNKGKKYTKQWEKVKEIIYFSASDVNISKIVKQCDNFSLCDIFANEYQTILEQKPKLFSISNNILDIGTKEFNRINNESNLDADHNLTKDKKNKNILLEEAFIKTLGKANILVEYCDLKLDQFYLNIIQNYLTNKLNVVFAQARLSEESNRLVMMDASIKNAEELLSTLTIDMNKKRQNSITNQIIEINAASSN